MPRGVHKFPPFCGIILDADSGFYKIYNGKNQFRYKCSHDKETHRCGSEYCKRIGLKLGFKVGTSFCEHNRIRSHCKDCGGASMCEHGRQRHICKDCGGASMCEHGRQRHLCKNCGGASVCEHGRKRSQCKDCGGASVCEHGRQRSACPECPMGEKVKRALCSICAQTKLSGSRRFKLGICAKCEKVKPERIEVTFGRQIIDVFGHEPNTKDKSVATSSRCADLEHRRPDLLWVHQGKVAVVVEIDENSHVDRETSCEIRKISEQNLAIQELDGCANIPVHTIRVNPDAYDGGDFALEDRAQIVADIVRHIFNDDSHEPNGFAKMYFVCYHSKAQFQISAHAEHWISDVI